MPAKIYPCSKVRFAFIENVESISSLGIVLKHGQEFTVVDGQKITFTEQLSAQNPMYVNQTLSLMHISDSNLANSLMERRIVFLITFSNNKEFVWGSSDVFARVSACNTNTNEGSLTFARKTVRFEVE